MGDAATGVARLDRAAGWIETALYVVIGAVLVFAATLLVGESAYNLVTDLDDDIVPAAREALDALLLTFIFVELFAAVRVTIRQQQLVAEPFFLVGIIASIKEIVLLVGAEDLATEEWEDFRNGLIEVGVLAGVVLVLTVCTLLARRRLREPTEEEESDAAPK
jgi:uncharacterized membrane protein (DUF373 family)